MSGGRRVRGGALLGGILVYVALAEHGMRDKSPTFDEVALLPAGYMHWTKGDYRLVPEHPPLAKALAALPLLAMDVRVPEDDPAWARRRHYEFGRRFLFEWNDGQRLITAGRRVVVALGALLLALTSIWAFGRWGAAVGAVTLYLGALNPELLAHGQLATTDVAAALAILAALLQLERWLGRPSLAGAALAAALVGVACAVKFSGLILVPLFAALSLVAVWGGRPRRLALFAAPLALALVIAPLVVWAAYGFRARVTPDAAVNQAFALHHERPRSELLFRGASLAQRFQLLPDAYLYGLLRFARHSEQRRAFLLGERSDEGWWYYFPVTLALKTPLTLLLLAGAALLFFARAPRRHARDVILWLPPLVYLAVAMSRGLNIGHRHLLPLLPFLIVGAARASVALWRRGGRPARAALALLGVWYAASTLRIHPHQLAYFNELVGAENGYRHLVDSNLDWGQDLPGLKAYMDAHGVERIKLSYFGTAEPAFYGIRGERLPGYPPPPSETAQGIDPGELVAVSATNLQAVYLTDDPDAERLMRRLRRQRPIAQVGYSILIYRAEFRWRRP